MKTFNSWVQKYLIFAFPVVAGTIVWGLFQSDSEIRSRGSFALTALWEVMSCSLILWFIALAAFMVLLVVRKDTQEASIKFLAGIKERDEREEAIVGTAASRSFVATTALLIFLLFASCFTLSVTRLPDHAIDGKRSSLSLGFRFSGTDLTPTTSEDGRVIFEHGDLPLSKSAILLLVLVWQLAAFRFKFRRDLMVA